MPMKQSKALLMPILVTAFCGCATAEEAKVMGKFIPKGEKAQLEPGGSMGVVGFAPQTSPLPISSYIVNLPPKLINSKTKKEMYIEPQLLFIDEESAQKAFGKKDELQKMVLAIIGKSKLDLNSSTGKHLIKGELLAKLNEAGYAVEGVLWNAIRL